MCDSCKGEIKGRRFHVIIGKGWHKSKIVVGQCCKAATMRMAIEMRES